MPLPEIAILAERLGVDLGPSDERTKAKLLSLIDRELRDLQVPEPSAEQHERQIVLVEARGELLENGDAASLPSTDLVSLSAVNKMLENFQRSVAQAPISSNFRVGPAEVMRTTVKSTATQASADFTKKRIIPLSVAGGLVATIYGYRRFFGVGELRLSANEFPLFFGGSIMVLGLIYGVLWLAQVTSNRVLRALYNPDAQEEALNQLISDTSDFFGDHSNREIGIETLTDDGRAEWAVARDDDSFIISRALYRDALSDLSFGRGRGGRLLTLLSTMDLVAATDDATGLALDRLIDLGIIESIVYRRRHGFRVIPTK